MPNLTEEMESLIPARGFIRYYVDQYIGAAGVRITDAPDSFHITTAYTLMGLALLDRVSIGWAGQRLRPNISSILLADSGIWRKTTALNLGIELLKKDLEFETYLGADEASAEGLIGAMLDGATMMLAVYPEMLNLFTVAGTWGTRVLPMFMHLLDCPSRLKICFAKKGKKDEAIRSVRDIKFALFGCANMAGLNNIRDVEALWSNGFFARLLLVAPADHCGVLYPDTRPARDIVKIPGIASATHENKLIKHLWYLRNVPESGQTITGLHPEAAEMFADWQDSIQIRCAELPVGFNRFSTHAIKLAMVLNTDLHYGEPEIQPDAMTFAIRFCNMSLRSTERLRGAYQPDKQSREMLRVLALVEAAGAEGVTQSALLRKTRYTARKMIEITETLIAANELKRVERTSKTKPSQVFVICNPTEQE